VRKSRNRGRDARGLGGRRPIRLTVRSGGVVASGGRNAFWLRASERPCRSEVMEVLWWWWQGGSRGEGSRSFFTSPLQLISSENAFWLRAPKCPCQSEVMEVLWWWQGRSRGEGSRSFFTSPL
jgi:hypothetical protein